MKNPNGYGSVVKLSGNRRNPFAVRKTLGWNDKGHPIYQTIGYYPTREAGMIALAEFNKSPWDIDAEKVTLASLYELWSEKKLCKLGNSSQSSLKSAYKHTKPLWNMKYKEIKSFHMQDVIDNCGCGSSSQGAIKNLFGHLDKFALEIDVINKGYSQLVTTEPTPETIKKPFTDDEILSLWGNQNDPWVDSILFLLYTGFRIGELIILETANVNLDEKTIKGGIKTKAGKDRMIPIHSKIQTLVANRVNEGNKYLFSYTNGILSKASYYILWNSMMEKYNLQHTPHECRHTFRSRLDSVGANKKCIDMMMGHKSKEIGERVYTHKTLDELREAIELIKN